MKALGHKVVALTGAASGIGQMLAVRLADHRCRLALCDINKAGLEQTKKMAESRGASVTCHSVNVADRKQMYEFASNVAEIHGGVDMIINNAGVALAESITDVKYDDFEWLFGINFWGVVYGSKAFLPYLIKQPEGHIVNISSINGFITWPNHAPYCAAKFAVRGFTETLMQEMRNTHVHVSCVFPGGIKTQIARNTRFYKTPDNLTSHDDAIRRFDKMAHTSADMAAKIIISGIRKNKGRILVGLDAHIMDRLTRFFPIIFTKIMASMLGEKLR